ncbi:tripartite tricarboxylate transporter TctB family protein [Starkeya koreensis]|uniref:Tripartite tricarboxylate transporter TctB family protein n=1 Tax=Ancylobacter koreensis TaxID=266121 RepID=A0ABT0DR41_9HYPH|nr:tripartite tricarboxylate transporter TctB family protein [Ancylobacter koreensis]MCK0209730.1 tripartite tricarboxylate transporter TctB family protein [Ancylobacter koreensis]
MSSERPLRKADFVTSIAFMLLGTVMIVAASRMPWIVQSGGLQQDWYLSPGLFPAVLGVLLILFSANVLMHAVRAGGHRGLGQVAAQGLRAIGSNRDLHRMAAAAALVGLYVFVGIGRFEYHVASTTFLFVTMLAFHRAPDRPFTVWAVLKIALIALIAPAVIGYIFTEFFQVPMP